MTRYQSVKCGEYICITCGKVETPNYCENQRMVAKQVCFTCNFWIEKVWEKLTENWRTCRIDGRQYYIEDDGVGYMKGMGGRPFRIRCPDGTTRETRNLWTQGAIPAQFRAQLPDNAAFEGSAGAVVVGGITYFRSSNEVG